MILAVFSVGVKAEPSLDDLFRQAEVTLASGLCLGRWQDAERFAREATVERRQFAFILAALTGRAEGVRRSLDLGAGIKQRTKELYSHATALHHAVCSRLSGQREGAG